MTVMEEADLLKQRRRHLLLDTIKLHINSHIYCMLSSGVMPFSYDHTIRCIFQGLLKEKKKKTLCVF